MLEEMDVYRRKVEPVVQQLVGFHYQVALCFSLNFQTCLMQTELSVSFVQDIYFQSIFYGNRIENGFQIMVSVRTLLCDISVPGLFWHLEKSAWR